MTNKGTQTRDLLQTLFDPNSTDAQVNQAIASMIKMDKEEGLPPKEERPRNKHQVCELLAKQLEETTYKELEHYLDHYYKSIEVAKLVARHPNIGVWWSARLTHYLPEDVKLNPRYEEFQKHEKWQELLQSKPDRAKCKYDSYNSLNRHTVSEDKPHVFKVHYWLANGSAADKAHIAGMNKVSEELLRRFSKDKSAHVRKALAKRKNLSLELASDLVTDSARTIRETLAENASCPPEILTRLSQDKESTVIKAALANKSCPADAVHAARLAEQMKPKPKQKPADQLNSKEVFKLLGDVNTGPEKLLSLASLEDAYIRAGVALHRNCSNDLLVKLSEDQINMVKASVAFNSSAPVDVLKNILDSGDSYFYLALASNPNLSEQDQLTLVEKADDDVRLLLADITESEVVWRALIDSEPTTKPAKKSSKRKTWRECLEICLDPKAKGLYALQRSAHYRYHFVNKLVARHPSCPDSLKRPYAFYLFSSLAKNPKIALQLLENPNAIVPEEYAEWKIKNWLMYDELPGHVIKYYLNNNHVKYSRKGVLSRTAHILDIQPHVFDDDIHIKKNIASLSNCTQFMFEVLARDVKEPVRAAVVANPLCPENVLAFLFKDKVASIRVSARNHKNFNPKLVDASDKPNKVESLKDKGPKRNRIKQAKETTSLTVLRDLVGDKVAEVRLSVIENRKAPLDVLKLLKDDESEEIRARACSHHNSSLDISEHLFTDPHERVRAQALRTYIYETSEELDKENYRNRKYDEAILKDFHADESDSIRAFVAERILDLEIQKKYAQESSQKIRKSLAQNFNLDKNIALELARGDDLSVASSLAQKTHDKEVFIATLAHDDAYAGSLGRNHEMCASLDVQQVLIAHKKADIRAVAVEHTTDPGILNLGIQDSDRAVLKQAAYNEALSEEQVKKLVDKADREVMDNLHYCHENSLKKNLAEYSEHSSEVVRAFFAEHIKLNKAAIEKFVADPLPRVRRALVENYETKLSDKALEALRNDENESVRRAVEWRFD